MTVGVDPKGMKFTSDCQKLIVANEGRGGQDAGASTFVDPFGSVTIINRNDVGGGPAIVTIDFSTFLAGRYVLFYCTLLEFFKTSYFTHQ